MKLKIAPPNILDGRFYTDAGLLNEIHKELDKDHKLDHKEKTALFLVRITAELKDPKDHVSAALKGDSSAGKDSAIDTILKHTPKEDNFKLTRATASFLEDEAEAKKCIAFSEINKHREGGANAEITETFKQLAEGGLNVGKKDPATGYRTSKHSTSEQKTLLYGTTETESDEELETRYVIIPIRGYPTKNKVVVDDTLQKARSEKYYVERYEEEESWIAKGIRQLEHDIQVIIPFTEALEKPITDSDGKEKYFFDYTKERIKRDAKRLLSITRAITWLYQKQRLSKEIEGEKFIYSEPTDFITAVRIFAEFFNLTYTGLDHRLQACYEKIKDLEGKHEEQIKEAGYENIYDNWVMRHLLQEELGIQSINTIKNRISVLKDFQLVETHYQQDIPKGYLIRGCQQGVNRVSLPVSLTAIDTLLTGYLTGKNWYDNNPRKPIKLDFLDDEGKKQGEKGSVRFEKLTPSKLTPSKLTDIHTPKSEGYLI